MTEHRQWPPETVADKVAAIKLAAGYYRERGAREQAVRDSYGPELPSMTRFWQYVRVWITEEAVMSEAPIEVRQLLSRLRTPQQQAALSRARKITRERAW